MGIGGVTSLNRMTVMQTPATNAPDAKSKKIQNEITDAEQKLQKLSSDVELSHAEKTDEQKTLKKEISGLNTKLEQRQEELVQAQKKESLLAELRENQKPAKEEGEKDDPQAKETSQDTATETNKAAAANEPQAQQQGTVIANTNDGTVILKEMTMPNETQEIASEKEQAIKTEEENAAVEEAESADDNADTDTSLSREEMRAMVSQDASAQLASRQGAVIAKTDDGIAILKGEIAQDERRGVNTERKQAELEEMQKQEERALAFQFSVLGELMDPMESANATNAAGIEKIAQEEQPQFQVSIA